MGLLDVVHLIFYALYLVVLAGVILSWVEIGARNARWLYHPAVNLIRDVSFQILRPFRLFLQRIGLRTGPIDFSPIIALLAIQLLEKIVLTVLFNIGIR